MVKTIHVKMQINRKGYLVAKKDVSNLKVVMTGVALDEQVLQCHFLVNIMTILLFQIYATIDAWCLVFN